MDKAAESARGEAKIGTTSRGIGPAYEDKMARRGIRVCDLLEPECFRVKLERVIAEKNLISQAAYGHALETAGLLDQSLEIAAHIRGLVADTASAAQRRARPRRIRALRRRAGHDAGHRPRHLSLRHVFERDFRRRGHRTWRRAHAHHRRRRRHQGVHHARRQRSFSHGDARPRRRRKSASAATNSARSPDARAAAAGSIWSCCATRKCSTASTRSWSPSSTSSTRSPKSRSAPATATRASCSRECRRTWKHSRKSSPNTARCPAGRNPRRAFATCAICPLAARDYLNFISDELQVEIGMISTGPERDATIVPRGTKLASWL